MVPTALRAAGWDVITIAEVFGEPGAQRAADTEWLELAGRNGWPVLLRDATVLRRREELAALADNAVQAFCLMHRHLTGPIQAQWLLAHGRRMVHIVQSRPGPFMYGIFSPQRMDELWRPDSDLRRVLRRR